MTRCAGQLVRTEAGWAPLWEWMDLADASRLVPADAASGECRVFRVRGVLDLDPNFSSDEVLRELGAGRAVMHAVPRQGMFLRLPWGVPVRVTVEMDLSTFKGAGAPPKEGG